MPTFDRTVVGTLLIAGLAAPLATVDLAAAKPLHRSLHRRHAHVAQQVRPPVYDYEYGYGRPAYYGGRHALRYPPGYGPNSADPYAPYYVENPYNPNAAPGAAIRALALRNQYAPGVTNELAPDNIATATGGPSGGVPGFNGR